MKLADVRSELQKMAKTLADLSEHLADLAEETRRRSPIRKAPSTRKGRLPPGVVQTYLRHHPNADYEEIARVYDTNVGRVSENLRGKRA